MASESGEAAAGEKSTDLFSTVSANYARFRPTYPDALFAFLLRHCTEPRRLAWDIATGSGQAAVKLAEAFPRVVATDISASQLAHAVRHPNISYAVTKACLSDDELLSTIGPPGSVDLITIAQGYHWFNFDYFPRAVRSVLRPGGVVAVWGYGLPRISPEFDVVMGEYYQTTFPFWEPPRKYIDDGYLSIPFPFAPLPGLESPEGGGTTGTGPLHFSSELQWSLHDYFGYLLSWSPVPTARRQGVELLNDGAKAKFQAAWGNPDTVRTVHIPIFLRIGTVDGST